MSQHDLALVFYVIGGIAIVFTLIRTYWRVWKIRKETAQSVRPNRSSKTPPGSQNPSV